MEKYSPTKEEIKQAILDLQRFNPGEPDARITFHKQVAEIYAPNFEDGIEAEVIRPEEFSEASFTLAELLELL